MSVCHECNRPASEKLTRRYPNGDSLTRFYCKIHSPTKDPRANSGQFEYSDENPHLPLYDEQREKELEEFANEKRRI